jgi:amino acid permease
MNWASGFATILLAFLSHPTFFNIRDELSHPSARRVSKVVKVSIIFETCLFIIVALFGYLSLGDSHMVSMFVLRESVGKVFAVKNSGNFDYLIEGAIYAFII